MLAFRVLAIADLHRMKREGRKIVGVVAWDYQIAQIADRAGVDIVSVGDSVGVKRAIVNCDLRAAKTPIRPFGSKTPAPTW